MSSTPILPLFITIKSHLNSKYFIYDNDRDDLDPLYRGVVRFIGEDPYSEYAQFEVVQANTGPPGKYVHLKSSYTNKFVGIMDASIAFKASAEQPVEEYDSESAFLCTMLEPVLVDADNPKVFNLRHVGFQLFLANSAEDPDPPNRLSYSFTIAEDTQDISSIYTIDDIGEAKLDHIALPVYIAIKSNYNSKYLRYVNDEGSNIKGFVQCSGDDVYSPEAKFEVVTANTGTGLVHLRSLSNKKYLRSWKEDSRWTVAEADAPEEDKSLWTSTLFEPLALDNSLNNVYFRHVNTGLFTTVRFDGDDFDGCLLANNEEAPNASGTDVYTVVSLE